MAGKTAILFRLGEVISSYNAYIFPCSLSLIKVFRVCVEILLNTLDVNNVRSCIQVTGTSSRIDRSVPLRSTRYSRIKCKILFRFRHPTRFLEYF